MSACVIAAVIRKKQQYTTLCFGKYAGETVWNCPEHYLRWLVSQQAITAHFRQIQEEARDPLACADDGEMDYVADDDFRWDR